MTQNIAIVTDNYTVGVYNNTVMSYINMVTTNIHVDMAYILADGGCINAVGIYNLIIIINIQLI